MCGVFSHIGACTINENPDHQVLAKAHLRGTVGCEIVYVYVFCCKWSAVPFSRYLLTRRVTQVLVGVWPSYLSSAALALLPRGLWTSRSVLRVIVFHATRENSQTCRPHAVIGRQRLSLRSSGQWAGTAQFSPVRGRVTDQAPTTTVRALRRRRAPERRWRVRTPKRPVQNDVAVPFKEVAARPVRRHRHWAVGVAAGPTRRQPSHQLWQGSTPLCLLCCACCSALGDCFSSLCSFPSVLTLFSYSALVPAVSPYP